MARTYREIAIEDMVLIAEEAMSSVLDWWADLPPSMKEAIEPFRTELWAAIGSVEFVKRAPAWDSDEIDQSIPIVAETEQVPNRRNSRLNSRAQISDGSAGRFFVLCGERLHFEFNQLRSLRAIEWE